MFKGESELNVFNDKTALKQLVDKFSDIRIFDEFVEYTKSFEEKSNAAYLKEMRSDDKVSRDAKSLESRIMSVSQKIGDNKRDIRDIETSIEVFSTRLEELEANQETSERYKEIEARRKTQEDKKIKIKALISAVDYNHSLHHLMSASFTPPVPNSYGTLVCLYPRAYALYEVSVRQTRCLPQASFRFHLTMDTFALGYAIPAIRVRSGLAPVS